MKSLSRIAAVLVASSAPFLGLVPLDAVAQSDRALDVRSARAVEHWTPERRAAAIPRHLVIDERGLGYLRGRGNQLQPYGHNIAALGAPAKDSTGPAVSAMSPAAGAVIGASANFSANVADPSGVKTVTFYVRSGNAAAQSFAATKGTGDVWSANLSGFTNGAWSWYVVAKDGAKPGNTTTSAVAAFTVSTGGGGGGGGGSVPNAEWTGGGVVQDAAGRIYFEMPSNAQRTRWAGYVCSGTVTNDGTPGRSIIITASHCVYDDANKAFARNVLFIPDQAETSGTGTDTNCANDPIGCWAPAFGVVDVNWTTRTFPNNVAWDYAFYVVNDTGAHSAGLSAASNTLDAAVVPMDVSFAPISVGALSHALGYSYDVDPQFMYCADPIENMDAANWWLPNCGLSGGSSGGPWSQPFSMTTGNGPIISVNSWGYTNQPGMAGPKLAGTSASCIYATAKSAPFGTFTDG
ncbi:MAG TPA: Ig-like domain-containing protein, partial [Steroidobacteraceae bacterium]|nr:Ig-like domain-containing protein [Steroidobacteraceae bacterium]